MKPSPIIRLIARYELKGRAGMAPAEYALLEELKARKASETSSCEHEYEANFGLWDTAHRYCRKCGTAE